MKSPDHSSQRENNQKIRDIREPYTQNHKHPGFVVREGLCFEEPPSTRNRLLTPVLHADGTQGCAPRWDVFEKKVLRFFAVTEDEIVESRDEKIRSTYVEFLYYLEDETISINLLKLNPSGMPTGVLLRRHRIDSISLHDFIIGDHVTIYGRSYEIVGADAFTMNHLKSSGSHLDHSAERNTEESAEPSHVSTAAPTDVHSVSSKIDRIKTRQFLSLDGKVLRFYACEGNAMEIRNFVLLYFLADDTLEVREQFAPNCGRDEACVWFRRGKVDRGGHALSESLEGPTLTGLFDIKNVQIGSTVELLHMSFHVLDADLFTRGWFRDKFRVELGPKIDFPGGEAAEFTAIKDHESRDIKDYSSILPSGDVDRVVLRCHCRLDNAPQDDVHRRFILSYSLLDNRVSIFEPHVKNSGIIGGRFLEKGSYTNSLTGKPILPEDLHEGSKIGILGRTFEIQECDTFTQTFVSRLPELMKHPPEIKPTHPTSCRNYERTRLDELMRTRNGFDIKLLKELSSLTKGANHASIDELDKAVGNLGFTIERDELKMVCSSLTKSTEDSFNIYDLIHMLKRSKRSV